MTVNEVGIRALKKSASALIARAAAGETITITRRGRPVAQLIPPPRSRLDLLIAAGLATPPRRSLDDLPMPAPGPPLSPVLEAMRADERY